MPDTHKFYAPAKLNLFLHVTGRRADGYHTLQTVFQFIDLCDEIRLRVRHDGVVVCTSDLPGLAAENDLSLRAARLLQQHSGTSLGADIQVFKHIPAGGGLGGGSSDAATVLKGLNALWQCQLPKQELAQLGLQLGADVPVFVHGQAAWAEGVGEKITPMKGLAEPWYLVVHPGVHVSTAEIFSSPELTRDTQSIKICDFRLDAGHNDCEAVACQSHPQIRQALDWLNVHAKARMTGTGACVFAAFESAAAAQEVLSSLPLAWRGWVARGMNFIS